MTPEPSVPREALAAIRAPFAALPAPWVDAPVIQPLGLLLDLAGETMRARLFVVQGEGGEEACLRPDFTIPVARAHIAAGEPPGRHLYEGKAFRVAPRGSGRAEEFLQIGLEVFGEPVSPEADAEVAALAWRAAVAGGRGDLSIILGDVALFAAFIEALGLAEGLAARLKQAFSHPRALRRELARAQAPAEDSRPGDRLAALLGGLSEADAVAALEDVWALAGIQPVGGRSPVEIAHRLAERAATAQAPRLSAAESQLVERFLQVSGGPADALAQVADLAREGGLDMRKALQAWRRRLAALAKGGVDLDRATLVTGFGRAFDYYDGFLFEVRSASLGDEAPVAAGGRYDSLTRKLGGQAQATSAVGCMVRPGRAWAQAERRP